VRFVDLVTEELILDGVEYRDRDDALRSMAGLLVEQGYCQQPFVGEILERERHHPSGLPMPGPKIAIPHTDATYVNTSVLLFARLAKPVEFGTMGSPESPLQVGMISMFALKEPKKIGDLLETLINVYQNVEVLEAIESASSKAEIYRILQTNVEKYGVG
jgi:PTS system galactitol-specific IIA component